MIYKTPIRSALSLSPSSFCSIRKGFIACSSTASIINESVNRKWNITNDICWE